MKKLLISVLFCLGLFAAQRHAHAQNINPGTQIKWPASCGAGVSYSPASNTCIDPAAQVIVIGQCTQGSDVFATLNNCATLLPNGGTIDARALGATNNLVTTQLTALATASRPITLWLDPSTKFTINTVFSPITSSSCVVPVGNGSAIVSLGFNQLEGQFRLGPSAAVQDVICNADMSGAQQSFVLDGIGVMGNASATMQGALIHDKNTFIGTRIVNSSTYEPYGNAVVIEGGSDQYFANNNFSDAAPSGNYVGTVVTLNCVARVNFYGGAIQDNGIHNNLMLIQDCQSGSFGQTIGAHFYGVDFETQAATVGSFTGHATNVDPVIMTDPSDVLIDGFTLYGNKGAGQLHMLDIEASGANGQVLGPVEIDNVLGASSNWASISLINNTVANVFSGAVPANLVSVTGNLQNCCWVAIGKYRWEGGTTSNETDYEDNKNAANSTASYLNVVPQLFAKLPSCSTSAGQIAIVSNSATNVYGSTITGGGTYTVQAFCGGATWVVTGYGASVNTQLIQSMTICASGCTNTASICTTSALAWNSGACFVGSFGWPIVFADANYAVTCQYSGAISGSGAEGAQINVSAQSATTIGVALSSTTATAISVPQINCTAVHR